MLNPRQIEAFRWVMLRGSVTGAAHELGISQPAVSRLLRDFEAAVGVALFERHGNHLRPTPEAGLLLGEVERYATGMRAISRFAADLESRRRGSLRVIALPAIAMGYLPRFAAGFIAGRPLSNVQLHGMPSHLVIEAVGAGQADIGIAAAPVERAGLRIEPLAARAVLAVPARHRLASRRRVKVADLSGERVIVLAEPTIFGSRTELLLAGVDCETVVTTPLSGIACTLVSCGAGIAIVDPFSVADFRDRGVVAVRLEPPLDVRIAIVTAVERRLSALAQEFVDAFREHVAKG
jgi:DNA-binding transcriptional LysR family regulator